MFELPPLHPILVNFTAALVPVSFVSDVLGRLTRRESLHHTAWWTMLYAAAVTPFTVVAGWYWLNDTGGMDHPWMDMHKWLGTSLAGLFLALAFWRWRIHVRCRGPSVPYLLVSGLLVGSLTVQGHLGGMLSFGGDIHPEATGESVPHSGDHKHGRSDPMVGIEWRDAIEVGPGSPAPADPSERGEDDR